MRREAEAKARTEEEARQVQQVQQLHYKKIREIISLLRI